MNLNEVNRTEKIIDYQSSAVVSKTLIKKGKGTITVFAFDKGQELSEHTAPFDALVQILDGKANVIIAGKTNILQSGDMIIMPANKPHGINAIERFKMMLTMIRE